MNKQEELQYAKVAERFLNDVGASLEKMRLECDELIQQGGTRFMLCSIMYTCADFFEKMHELMMQNVRNGLLIREAEEEKNDE